MIITDGKLSLFCDRHVRGWGGEAFPEFIGVVAFHGHADPGKLHPDPSFVVVIRGGFLVELKLFHNCLGIEVLQVFKVFGS
jgi:hypothetical protein